MWHGKFPCDGTRFDNWKFKGCLIKFNDGSSQVVDQGASQ